MSGGDSLTSSLRLTQPISKIHFDKDEKNLMDGVQSPNNSSPSTDVLEVKDMKFAQ